MPPSTVTERPCAKCGHEHEGGPCRERVERDECKCWRYEAPRVSGD